MLTGDPRWTHRRRLVYATITFAVIMVTIGAFDWTDRQVSSQLVIGGVSLITLILTGYVFAATYDDKWQRTEHEPLTSIRRTVVPMIMGWIASLPIAPLVDQQQVEAALVVLLGATYYTVLRWLEDRGVDAAGWWIAFGRTTPPEYPDAV
jgi:uncharacterized membrane protein